MIRTRFLLLILIFSWHGSTITDQFSQYAEAHNVLDYLQLNWPIRPWPIDLKLFGYVKAESIFDSRQTFAIRDGHLLYFPLEILPDRLGADINARGDFDMYAIQSRLDLSGIGPDICGFESGFLIEADFFGRTDETLNTLSMRFAYLELRSDTLDFQAGQNFHPICYPFESPDTISFNSGIPIAPFALCPQFKVTYHKNNIEFIAASIGFLGDRPFGFAVGADKVFRDAIMPDFYVQARLKYDDENYIGVGFDVMRIVPRLATNLNFKEISPLTNISADLFTRCEHNDMVLYTKIMYSQAAAVFELIGGIGVHSVNPLTDKRTYAALQTLACYAEIIRIGAFEPALFIGFAKNLGATRSIIPILEDQEAVFGIGTNINTVWRVSPRIRWYINSFIVGIEYEYTNASYGIINTHGRVEDTMPVANNRFLFATYYVF
jgi:hypothetical protein